jgi:hypothetical protein
MNMERHEVVSKLEKPNREYTNQGTGIIQGMVCGIQVLAGPTLQSQREISLFRAIHEMHFTFSSMTEANIAPSHLNQEKYVVGFVWHFFHRFVN